jgi:hypothetical protein
MTAWYEIRVREVLGSQWSTWFAGMTILTEPEDCPGCGTLLSGNLADQAELFGMLSLLRDMNLTLLEVRLVSEPGVHNQPINLNE